LDGDRHIAIPEWHRLLPRTDVASLEPWHIIDRRARSQRSATSASSINVPEFDVMLREAAWGAPAVLPELLEERLAIGLIELAPPACVCVHDVGACQGLHWIVSRDGQAAGLGSSNCIAPSPWAIVTTQGASAATATTNIVLPPSRPSSDQGENRIAAGIGASLPQTRQSG
jgi:hypothetical protein